MSEHLPQASQDELSDWNRRVRRLATDYAPKYRPVLFPIAYHYNLDEGRSWLRVETIAKESARYTSTGKPLSARQIKRLVSEMEQAGAVKTEARFSEDTGRQRSSYRYLVTSVAVNRYGYSVPHDFHAPFPQVNEGSQEDVTGQLQVRDTPHVTPRDTPRVTPHVTPRTTFNSLRTSSRTTSDTRGSGNDLEEVKVGPAAPGDQNTIYFWKDGQGQNRVYSQDKYDRLAARRQARGRAKRVELTPDEAVWMWKTWPKGFPDAQMEFLAVPPAIRAKRMASADQEQQVRDTRKAAVRAATADGMREIMAEVNRAKVESFRNQLVQAGVSEKDIQARMDGEWRGLPDDRLSGAMGKLYQEKTGGWPRTGR